MISTPEKYFTLPAGAGLKRHEHPLWIWDCETGRFLWANGAGIDFWGAAGLNELQSNTAFTGSFLVREIEIAFDEADGVDEIRLQLKFPTSQGERLFQTVCRRDTSRARQVMIVEVTSHCPLEDLGAKAQGVADDDQVLLNAAMPLSDERSIKRRLDQSAYLEDAPVEPQKPREKSAAPIPLGGSRHAALKQELTDTSTKLMPAIQMSELAKLIEAAQTTRNELAENGHGPHAPAEDASDNRTELEACVSEEIFEGLSLDMTALTGAGDEGEIDEILSACRAPLALVHLPRILHANEAFVSELGYGDFTSLGNDGTDWILPHSRNRLTALINEDRKQTIVLDKVRLCSGRVNKRPVYVRSVRLTRFNRLFLLILLREAGSQGRAQKGALIDALNDVPLLSVINHEVRTPLNIILGFSEMMMREEFGPLGHNKYSEYARDINQSASHALHLINDMLDLSKLQSGNWQISPQPLEINEVARAQVHLMRGIAAERDVRLRSFMEENLPQVMADERVLSQILINLMSNGIKFNQTNGSVTVKTGLLANGDVELIVEDTGPGMSEGELETAFHPFQQNDADAQAFGTGLGLPIVKALAKASQMGFSISSRKEIGTTVRLILPSAVKTTAS